MLRHFENSLFLTLHEKLLLIKWCYSFTFELASEFPLRFTCKLGGTTASLPLTGSWLYLSHGLVDWQISFIFYAIRFCVLINVVIIISS